MTDLHNCEPYLTFLLVKQCPERYILSPPRQDYSLYKFQINHMEVHVSTMTKSGSAKYFRSISEPNNYPTFSHIQPLMCDCEHMLHCLRVRSQNIWQKKFWKDRGMLSCCLVIFR